MLALPNQIPIDSLKERVVLQVLSVTLLRAESALGVAVEQPLENAACFSREVRLHYNWLLDYILEHLLSISIIMWGSTAEHFIKECS